MQGKESIFLIAVGRLSFALLNNRDVLDFTWQYLLGTVAILQQHRVVLLSAITAEVNGVQALIVFRRKILLTIGSDGTLSWRINRAIGCAGAGDELVQAKRKEASGTRMAPAGAIRFRQ